MDQMLMQGSMIQNITGDYTVGAMARLREGLMGRGHPWTKSGAGKLNLNMNRGWGS